MTPKQSVTLAMPRLGSSLGRGPSRRGSWQHDYSIPLVEVLPYPDGHPCFGNERRTRHRPRVLRKSSYARTISTSRHRADCCVLRGSWIRAHARVGSVDGESLLAIDDKVDPSSPWLVGHW